MENSLVWEIWTNITGNIQKVLTSVQKNAKIDLNSAFFEFRYQVFV